MQQSIDSSDLGELAAFVALAETGTFIAAARRLGRDPTVISRRVQALERRLGVRLAQRSTRRVSLTEAGRAFLERVRPLLLELKAAEDQAAALASGEPQGRLRVALPSAFGRLWIAPRLPDFLARYPLVVLEAAFSNSYADLPGEGFDLAIRLGVLPDSRLIARKVADRRRLICAAPAYIARHGAPRQPADLASHACLRFTGKPNPHVWEFLDPSGGVQAVPVSGPFASDDSEALTQAGVAGAGLVYATDWLVGRELSDGHLVPVLEDWRMPEEGGIYVVTPSRSGLPSRTRAFADWIAGELARAPWRAQSSDRALPEG
jgi:DNA-binding transcriptional LysR family regulator